MPRIFRVKSNRGIVLVVVHLSVAESILRLGIVGLRLNEITGIDAMGGLIVN